MAKAAAKSEEYEHPPADPRREVAMDDVLGNEPVRAYLRRAWRGGTLPQTLLLSGPAGIGKTTLAYALMREMVAEGDEQANTNRVKKVERAVHPDVLDVRAMSEKRSVTGGILVENIRNLEDRAWTAPLEAPRKFALIDPAEAMNESAANALLKLLEEPPPHLLFLLIAQEPGSLLDTIRSRCVPLPLEPVAIDQLAPWLRGRTSLSEEDARLVAMLAEGRPGQALRLSNAAILGQRGRLLKALTRLKEEGFASLFVTADAFLTMDGSLEEALLMGMTLLRDALVSQTRPEGILNQDLREELTALGAACPAAGLLAAAEAFERGAHEAPYFYSPQSKAQFVEVLLAEVGKVLARGG